MFPIKFEPPCVHILERKRKKVKSLNSPNKRKKWDQVEDQSPGKNLLCQDLDQFSTQKKKIHWLKNGKFRK